ncbi:MAG: DNA polymerase III subunit delta [Paracoccaceae bacterium]|nr:DNA polymerase III subunit delta [Paracoccaceae bacterium]
MKLAGARAAAFCSKPDPNLTGALIYGPDSGLVALKRREMVTAIAEGDGMRLTRIDPAEAQKDPASIDAALRAQGFFPGRRVVLIEGAKDGLAKPLGEIMAGIGAEDAFLVVTADSLPARSGLRKLFEGSNSLAALGLYPEPPRVDEIESMLATAGAGGGLSPEAIESLTGAASGIDPGSLAQLIEKISVFCSDRASPLTARELAPLLPAAADSELDRLVAAVAEGRPGDVGPLIGRLAGAGTTATGMLIAAGRHFRNLMGAAAAEDGIDAALGRMRPPVFGPRRRAMADQTRRWGIFRLESANRLLFQADRTLRSPGTRPDQALVERCLIRLAMMAPR